MEQELKELWDLIISLNEATDKLKKYYIKKVMKNNLLLSEEDISLEEELLK